MDIVNALGAGSGVDVKSLAQSLVDAEKLPREDAINTNIDTQERRVAGYSALMLSLETLKSAFQKLNDKSDFNSAQANVENNALLEVSTTSAAQPGRHSVEVLQLATVQRTAVGGFSSDAQILNGGDAFSVSVVLNGGDAVSVAVSSATPSGVVAAINSADLGVTAQLMDTGASVNPYRIVLSGPMGAEGGFSFASDDATGTAKVDELLFGPASEAGVLIVAGVEVSVLAGDTSVEVAEKVRAALVDSTFTTNHPQRSITANGDGRLTLTWSTVDADAAGVTIADADGTGVTIATSTAVSFSGGAPVDDLVVDSSNLQNAGNAIVKLDGLSLTRSSNALDNAIPGVYIDLKAADPGVPTQVRIERDNTRIKDDVQSLIDTYNLVVSDLDILTGERSEDADDLYSGSLAGDSTVQRLRSKLRGMFLDNSTTPSGAVNAMRDIGLDVDRYGVLTLDQTKLDDALTGSFDDVMVMLSAGTTNQSESGVAGRGVAGEAIKSLNELISSRGTIATQSANAVSRSDDFKLQLEALNARMETLLSRYTKQFAVMEAFVGQTNAMRDSLTATFEGMMAMYTNK